MDERGKPETGVPDEGRQIEIDVGQVEPFTSDGADALDAEARLTGPERARAALEAARARIALQASEAAKEQPIAEPAARPSVRERAEQIIERAGLTNAEANAATTRARREETANSLGDPETTDRIIQLREQAEQRARDEAAARRGAELNAAAVLQQATNQQGRKEVAGAWAPPPPDSAYTINAAVDRAERDRVDESERVAAETAEVATNQGDEPPEDYPGAVNTVADARERLNELEKMHDRRPTE